METYSRRTHEVEAVQFDGTNQQQIEEQYQPRMHGIPPQFNAGISRREITANDWRPGNHPTVYREDFLIFGHPSSEGLGLGFMVMCPDSFTAQYKAK